MATEKSVRTSVHPTNVFGLTNPFFLLQTFCKQCFKRHFGIFSLIRHLSVRRRLVVLLALVLCQMVVCCFVIYPLLNKKPDDFKPSEVDEMELKPDSIVISDNIETITESESIDRTIFVITPTFSRLTQKADLTGLSQTLSLVNNLVWIVVEDSDTQSELVSLVLSRSLVKTVQLTMQTPDKMVISRHSWWYLIFPLPHRGIEQRNTGLEWLRHNYKLYSKHGCNGVVYFADDDNRYDVQIFNIMRRTEVLSSWPVGFRGSRSYEGPICKGTKVIYWRYSKKEQMREIIRAFPVDMAGFAVNLCQIVNQPFAKFESSVPRGHLENSFVLNFVSTQDDIECRGSNKEVLVWHVKTQLPSVHKETAEYELII